MPRRGEEGAGSAAGVRCFVAVDLAADVRAAIGAVVAELRRTGADVRWVAPEKLHVTLKFLGHLAEDRVAVVRVALARVAEATGPFVVSATGVGAFPNLRRARVVWVGLAGDALGALAELVDATLAAEGFPREARAFVPHITVGRVRGSRGWERLRAAMEPCRCERFGETQVSEIVLYRSELRPEGARYTPLERLHLAPASTPQPESNAGGIRRMSP